MNGYHDKPFDDPSFSIRDDTKSPINAVKAFDAFPKTKASYTERTANGGVWTIVLIAASIWLSFTELGRWWVGETTHSFSVEQGVGRDLQINIDLVVAMKCADLHINVQDASGDRVLAGEALKKDPTLWSGGSKKKGYGQRSLGQSKKERLELSSGGKERDYREEDVHDYLGAARSSKKFAKTPRVPRGTEADGCRVYGTIHTNKVQGDFHITARGHGYMEFGQHLDHSSFNFSHRITELSFGPHYPSLLNPLDNTVSSTENHFYKYQYYLSLVPTIYTTDLHKLQRTLTKFSESPSSGSDGLEKSPYRSSRNAVFTNQYAVTEQSHTVPEMQVPGLFVKYDVEPILLMIAEEWGSVFGLFIRLVNVVSGVIVAGGWCFQLSEWWKESYGRARRKRAESGFGILSPGAGDEKKRAL